MYVYACIWRARACVAFLSQRPDDEYTPESHARSYACTLKEDAETLAKTLDFYNAAANDHFNCGQFEGPIGYHQRQDV